MPVEKSRDWYIKRGEWHWDGRPDFDLPGLWVFTIYSVLPPQSGGTMLAGSHRLISRFFDDLSPEKRSWPTRIQKKYFRKRFDWFDELQDDHRDDHADVTRK